MIILAEFNDAECDLNCLIGLANFFQNDELAKIIMRRLKISKSIFLVNFLLRKFCILQKSIIFSSENYIFVIPLLKILSRLEIDETKQDLYDFFKLMLEYKEPEVKILSLEIIAKLFENNKNQVVDFVDTNHRHPDADVRAGRRLHLIGPRFPLPRFPPYGTAPLTDMDVL